MEGVEVHILPCLVNFNGKTQFNKLFKNKIRKVPENDSEDDSIPGGYDIKEICGQAAESVEFSVKVTERYINDLYYPLRGVDKLLRGKYYVFFRGRQLRGAQLALEDLGYKTVIVEVEKGPKFSELAKEDSVESKGLRKTYEVSFLMHWELEEDVSPLSPNVAAYRYLAMSKALSDYEGEEEYFRRFNSTG